MHLCMDVLDPTLILINTPVFVAVHYKTNKFYYIIILCSFRFMIMLLARPWVCKMLKGG